MSSYPHGLAPTNTSSVSYQASFSEGYLLLYSEWCLTCSVAWTCLAAHCSTHKPWCTLTLGHWQAKKHTCNKAVCVQFLHAELRIGCLGAPAFSSLFTAGFVKSVLLDFLWYISHGAMLALLCRIEKVCYTLHSNRHTFSNLVTCFTTITKNRTVTWDPSSVVVCHLVALW